MRKVSAIASLDSDMPSRIITETGNRTKNVLHSSYRTLHFSLTPHHISDCVSLTIPQ